MIEKRPEKNESELPPVEERGQSGRTADEFPPFFLRSLRIKNFRSIEDATFQF
jgi:hypothetical protein